MRRYRSSGPFEDSPLGCLVIIVLFGIVVWIFFTNAFKRLGDVAACLEGGDRQACGRCAFYEEACARANSAYIIRGD